MTVNLPTAEPLKQHAITIHPVKPDAKITYMDLYNEHCPVLPLNIIARTCSIMGIIFFLTTAFILAMGSSIHAGSCLTRSDKEECLESLKRKVNTSLGLIAASATLAGACGILLLYQNRAQERKQRLVDSLNHRA